MTKNSINPVSPVTQFSLLLAPVVMSCFLLVYSLTGWVLEGRDRFLWSLEAPDVALYTGTGIVIYCIVVMLYARLKGASRYHVLNVSSLGHMLLAALLSMSVYMTVKL